MEQKENELVAGALCSTGEKLAPEAADRFELLKSTPTDDSEHNRISVAATCLNDRTEIWKGMLEWTDLTKRTSNLKTKRTLQTTCSVASFLKDDQTELKGELWPMKLIMQLLPKILLECDIGQAYLRNSKSVVFFPSQGEAVESLKKLMSNGFAGCVHFTATAACNIKVLILFYTAEKGAFEGFIPNDQQGFVDWLRIVIQQKKIAHGMLRQGSLQERNNSCVSENTNKQKKEIEIARQQNLLKIGQLKNELKVTEEQEERFRLMLESAQEKTEKWKVSVEEEKKFEAKKIVEKIENEEIKDDKVAQVNVDCAVINPQESAVKNNSETVSTSTPSNVDTLNGSDSNTQHKKMKIEDALAYLDKVRLIFSNQPQVYDEFINTMREFKAQTIDTTGVITRVSHLLKDYPGLISGFNAFLPPGYKIDVKTDEENFTYELSVVIPESTTDPNIEQHEVKKIVSHSNAASSTVSPAKAQTAAPAGSGSIDQPSESNTSSHLITQAQVSQAVSQTLGQAQDGVPKASQAHRNQPVEFNQAINYVEKVKKRFVNQPEKYKRFLDILHTYRKQWTLKESNNLNGSNNKTRLLSCGSKPKTITEVKSQVIKLFEHHEDLLQEFQQFLADETFDQHATETFSFNQVKAVDEEELEVTIINENEEIEDVELDTLKKPQLNEEIFGSNEVKAVEEEKLEATKNNENEETENFELDTLKKPQLKEEIFSFDEVNAVEEEKLEAAKNNENEEKEYIVLDILKKPQLNEENLSTDEETESEGKLEDDSFVFVDEKLTDVSDNIEQEQSIVGSTNVDNKLSKSSDAFSEPKDTGDDSSKLKEPTSKGTEKESELDDDSFVFLD